MRKVPVQVGRSSGEAPPEPGFPGWSRLTALSPTNFGSDHFTPPCQENDCFMGSDLAGESDAASPGSGRAKLRLSRGFPVGHDRQRCPPRIFARITSRRPAKKTTALWGVISQARATREAPVRTEPHQSLTLPP
jgi:hypothetical protein